MAVDTDEHVVGVGDDLGHAGRPAGMHDQAGVVLGLVPGFGIRIHGLFCIDLDGGQPRLQLRHEDMSRRRLVLLDLLDQGEQGRSAQEDVAAGRLDEVDMGVEAAEERREEGLKRSDLIRCCIHATREKVFE